MTVTRFHSNYFAYSLNPFLQSDKGLNLYHLESRQLVWDRGSITYYCLQFSRLAVSCKISRSKCIHMCTQHIDFNNTKICENALIISNVYFLYISHFSCSLEKKNSPLADYYVTLVIFIILLIHTLQFSMFSACKSVAKGVQQQYFSCITSHASPSEFISADCNSTGKIKLLN